MVLLACDGLMDRPGPAPQPQPPPKPTARRRRPAIKIGIHTCGRVAGRSTGWGGRLRGAVCPHRTQTPYTPAASPTQLQQACGRVQVYVWHAHDVRRRLQVMHRIPFSLGGTRAEPRNTKEARPNCRDGLRRRRGASGIERRGRRRKRGSSTAAAPRRSLPTARRSLSAAPSPPPAPLASPHCCQRAPQLRHCRHRPLQCGMV